jgi:hypothetical protein
MDDNTNPIVTFHSHQSIFRMYWYENHRSRISLVHSIQQRKHNIMPTIRCIILHLAALSSSAVTAYVPSVHSHDHAIVTIKKPSIIMPTSTKEVPKHEPETIDSIAPSHLASVSRTKWGTDHDHPEEYWFDDRIHTLGNHGFGGAVHAALAPFSTKIIDLAAYHGEDVRLKVGADMM